MHLLRRSSYEGNALLDIVSNSDGQTNQSGVGGEILLGALMLSTSEMLSLDSFRIASNTQSTSSLEGSMPGFFPICLKDKPSQRFCRSYGTVNVGFCDYEFKGTIPR